MNLLMRARAMLALLGASMLLLVGCGGGSGSEPVGVNPNACNDPAGCGTTYIGITDADGDFLSYTVDVVSIKLRKANGTEVETLPNSTRVDFAQYVELTEFITAATIPNGAYVEGTLRLDYTNAQVTVERNGQPTDARVVGANGAPLGVVDVRVLLDNRNHLVVSPGRPSLLTLDFNLTATNSVDLNTTPVTVTARPTLIASLEPVNQKEIRLRGPLVSVDTGASSYVIDIRPFHHHSARHGRMTVHTTVDTAFEINGQSFTGGAGLSALQALGAGTPTVAFGGFTTVNRTFTAERVHAGSSVPGMGRDTVIGTVLSRTGDELIVRGGTIVRDMQPKAANARDDNAVFERGDIKVLVGPNTMVTKDGTGTQPLDAQALSVGQLIHAHGSVSNATGQNVLDATQGRVRMHHTHLFGSVVSQNPGLLTLNLAAINGRRIAAFNFAGTGATPADDAIPANYEVQTPPIMVSQFVVGRPMRVIGFVEPFGAAPPDFVGRTFVSYAELRAQLAISYTDGGASAPFTSMNATGLVLNLSDPNIGARHHIHLGPVVIDLASLTSAPTIVGASSGQTMFVIGTANGIEHFQSFADFVAALSARLGASQRLIGFTAGGYFDGVSNVLTAKDAVALLR